MRRCDKIVQMGLNMKLSNEGAFENMAKLIHDAGEAKHPSPQMFRAI